MKNELLKLIYEKMEYHKKGVITDYKAQYECFCKELLEILGEL